MGWEDMNNTQKYIVAILAIAVVAIAIASAFLTIKPTGKTAGTTTITTTVNATTATAPNLVSCDGFSLMEFNSTSAADGYCSWLGGLMNVTLSGGGFSNVVLKFTQINYTTTPYNFTFATSGCNRLLGRIISRLATTGYRLQQSCIRSKQLAERPRQGLANRNLTPVGRNGNKSQGTPNSKAPSILRIDGNNYRAKVDAPALEGRANARLLEMLSKHFNVSKSCVRIVRGFSSRDKVVEISI